MALLLFGLFVLIVATFGIIYTLKIGKVVSSRNEYDEESSITRKKPILLNPIFLAYLIAFAGLIIVVIYFALSSSQ